MSPVESSNNCMIPSACLRFYDIFDRSHKSPVSWLTILFAAGMGVGQLFWGKAEPLYRNSLHAPGFTFERFHLMLTFQGKDKIPRAGPLYTKNV
jgi:hypothetical protein